MPDAPDHDYVPAESLRREMGLSPVRFARFLREHRDSLPLRFTPGAFSMPLTHDAYYSRISLERAASILEYTEIHTVG